MRFMVHRLRAVTTIFFNVFKIQYMYRAASFILERRQKEKKETLCMYRAERRTKFVLHY